MRRLGEGNFYTKRRAYPSGALFASSTPKYSTSLKNTHLQQVGQPGHLLELVVRQGTTRRARPPGPQDRRDRQVPDRDLLRRRQLLLSQVGRSHHTVVLPPCPNLK